VVAVTRKERVVRRGDLELAHRAVGHRDVYVVRCRDVVPAIRAPLGRDGEDGEAAKAGISSGTYVASGGRFVCMPSSAGHSVASYTRSRAPKSSHTPADTQSSTYQGWTM
jgi:hypothetical protein